MVDWLHRDITPDEEHAIAAFMQRLAASPLPGTPGLAGHGALWWKAQLLRRWDEQRQAAAPLNVMEPIQIAVSLVAAGLILTWALPSLVRVFAGTLG